VEATLPSTNANYGSATVPLWVSLQEYPQFGNGGYAAATASSFMDTRRRLGVQLAANQAGKRLTQHFTTLASFTWAKLITDDGNPPLGFVGFHNGSPRTGKT